MLRFSEGGHDMQFKFLTNVRTGYGRVLLVVEFTPSIASSVVVVFR